MSAADLHVTASICFCLVSVARIFSSNPPDFCRFSKTRQFFRHQFFRVKTRQFLFNKNLLTRQFFKAQTRQFCRQAIFFRTTRVWKPPDWPQPVSSGNTVIDYVFPQDHRSAKVKCTITRTWAWVSQKYLFVWVTCSFYY